jgi:hypothetical protein
LAYDCADHRADSVIVVAGAPLCMVWLGIGIIRLRMPSRRSTPAALSDDLGP